MIEATLEAAAPALGEDFDLVVVSALLHEVIDCAALLDAVRSVCSPETIVHLNVPNARSFHRLLAVEMGLIETPTELSAAQIALQQHRTFTQGSLAALAEAHGFRVIDQGGYFVKPFTHAQMQALQADGFLTPQMLEGLWGMARRMPDLGSEIFVNLRTAAKGRPCSPTA